jgi:hypothetical protein
MIAVCSRDSYICFSIIQFLQITFAQEKKRVVDEQFITADIAGASSG